MDAKVVRSKIWGVVAILLWGCGSDSAAPGGAATAESSPDRAGLGSFSALPPVERSGEVRFQVERKIDGVFLAPLLLVKTLEGTDANGLLFREIFADLESGDVKRDSSRSEPSERSVVWEQATDYTISALCERISGKIIPFASAYGIVPTCRVQVSETVDGMPGTTTQWLTRVRFGLLEKRWVSADQTRSVRQSLFWSGNKGKF